MNEETADRQQLVIGILAADDLEEIREANEVLEYQGIADRLTELLGAPLTASLKVLPDAAEMQGAYHAIAR